MFLSVMLQSALLAAILTLVSSLALCGIDQGFIYVLSLPHGLVGY